MVCRLERGGGWIIYPVKALVFAKEIVVELCIRGGNDLYLSSTRNCLDKL